MWYNSTGSIPTALFFEWAWVHKTTLDVVLTQSTKNQQHGRIIAQSIGGHDGGRAKRAMQWVNQHCGEPLYLHSPWMVQSPWNHQWTQWGMLGSRSTLFELTMFQCTCQNWWYSGDDNNTGYLPCKSQCICFNSTEFMVNHHALSLWQDILRAIVGSVYAAHKQYEADCLNWQSIIKDGHELLSKADFGHSRHCVITITSFAGVSIISVKNGQK